MLTSRQIAASIDHAMLKPFMTVSDIISGCETAARYGAASVCVRGCDVKTAYDILKGTPVKTGTVIGFPHGDCSTAAKVADTLEAARNGAAEVDMVIPVGMALSGEMDYVRTDISSVLKAAHDNGMLLKVIFENCYLNDKLIAELCGLCSELKVDFVKTSTGFGTYGARIEDVKLMRASTDPSIGVKAAGGIHDLDELLAMMDAGASRIGASATEKIVEEAVARGL